MARKPQQNRSKATVDTIVEAGFISLARYGLDHTTTRHIADIAGVSVGSVYEYFVNKEMVYTAMHAQFVGEIMAMLRELTPVLVQKSVRGAVELMLTRFSELLRKNDGRYLHYIKYVGHFDHAQHAAQIELVLMDIIMKYVMNNPHLLKAPNIARVSYIIINAGIFSIIRHLSSPSPLVSFEELLAGLGDMVENYVEGELRKVEGA